MRRNATTLTLSANGVPSPITTQPSFNEDDYYKRTIQTNVPILAPEILAVFENSQIFQEHPKHIIRVPTMRSHAPISIHRQNTRKKLNETDEEKLIKNIEGKPQFF